MCVCMCMYVMRGYYEGMHCERVYYEQMQGMFSGGGSGHHWGGSSARHGKHPSTNLDFQTHSVTHDAIPLLH